MKNRKSSILISAPHGAKTHRETDDGGWHEEDEYTAGMALLLGEICDVSVIAMVAQSEESDPNHHDEQNSKYKQKLRELLKPGKVIYVIDLHGAAEDSKYMTSAQLVDLGLGRGNEYLQKAHREKLINLIEGQLGSEVTDRKGMRGFPSTGNTVAHFCYDLGASSVQIEMKPELRVAERKEDSVSFQERKQNIYCSARKNYGYAPGPD